MTARSALVVPVAVGALGLTGIALLHDIPVRHGIEDDLSNRSALALNRAGLGSAGVIFTGRDALIRDVTAGQAGRARDVVLNVRGVRVARVESIGTAPAPSTVPTTPSPSVQPAPADQPKSQLPVSLTFDDGAVTLTGWVGSQEQHDAIVEAVKAGGWTVTDQLLVDPTLAGATSPTADGLTSVVKAVPQPGDGLIVRYVGGDAQVRGTVKSTDDESAVLDAVRASGPGTTEDHVDVVPDRKAVQADLDDLPQITFVTGSATLTPAGKAAVARAAKVLDAADWPTVRVDGHTDASGSAALNQALSARRAEAVKAELIRLKARGKITTRGFGESEPLVTERTPADAAKNRRVEFRLV